jgi:hypothetical protein
MGRVGAVDRLHQTEVVDLLREMREEFADPVATFAILLERPGGLQQVASGGELHAGLGDGARLAVVAREQRLGVERVEV